MNDLKIFVWEGNGISEAYHDDGTLVVLAHTADEARQIMLKAKADEKKAYDEINRLSKEKGYSEPYYWRRANAHEFKRVSDEIHEKYPAPKGSEWDGSKKALNREPDEVIELDSPKFIAFNGGGYD